MMTVINPPKSPPLPPSPLGHVFQAHLSHLKATFVFGGSVFSPPPILRYYLGEIGRLVRKAPAESAALANVSVCVCVFLGVCVGLGFRIIHFSPYLFIIRQFNKCEVCSVMLDHPSEPADPGSVHRAPSRHRFHSPIAHQIPGFSRPTFLIIFAPFFAARPRRR